MRKDETLAIEMVKEYRKAVKGYKGAKTVYAKNGSSALTGYVIVEADFALPFAALRTMKRHARRYRMKSLHIKDIVPLSCKIIPMVWDPSREKIGKEYGLDFHDVTGIFKVKLSDNSIIIFGCIMTGYGSNKRLERYIATEKKTMLNWLKLLEKRRKYNQKPKNGFYHVFSNEGIIQYAKIEKKTSVPIVHNAISQLDKDMNFFFDNSELFTRYDMPGTRKTMLIGPPGTGKTSMCIKLALERSNNMPVVVAQDLTAMAGHLKSCSKHNLATIVIVEDAESVLAVDRGAGSGVLNFLDGLNQPVNKHGAYVIMTTNHPNRIEPRIIKRPGRIDKLISVGPLAGMQAAKCAKIYFNGTYTGNYKELQPVVDNMTGAQIKELAQSCFAYASQNQLELNKKTVETVKDRLTEDLSDAYKYAEDNTIAVKSRSVGFLNN